MTHIPAILKLAQILRKMLRTDVNVRTVDAALQHRPEALNAVHGATRRADVLLGVVVHRVMAVTVIP